jgi:hypothetical protein
MGPDERSSWEAECLRRLEEHMASPEAGAHQILQLRDARLSGVYPDTSVLVRFWDPSLRQERGLAFPLWRSRITWRPLFRTEDGTLQDPRSVAGTIAAWASGA